MLTDDVTQSLRGHSADAGEVDTSALLAGIDRRLVRRHRRRTAGAAASTLVVVAGVALGGALLATGSSPSPAPAHTPSPPATTPSPTKPSDGYRIEKVLSLRLFGNPTQWQVAQASDGPVYWADGRTVHVWAGTDGASGGASTGFQNIKALSADGPILALACDAQSVFVLTDRTLSAYSRRDGTRTARWRLPALSASKDEVPNEGGLTYVAVADAIYMWTAHQSGRFAYAQVVRVDLEHSTTEVLSRRAYPADVATNGADFFFETRRPGQPGAYLAMAGPGGTTSYSTPTRLDTPMTVTGDRVGVFLDNKGGVWRWRLYDTTTMQPVADYDSNDVGPVVLVDDARAVLRLTTQIAPCHGVRNCRRRTTEPVAQVTPALDKPLVLAQLPLPGAEALLPGPQPAALRSQQGKTWLTLLQVVSG